MTDRFSPGKWAVYDSGRQKNRTLQVGLAPKPGQNPCIVHWMGFDSCDEPISRRVANATLIACAPDMLAMLRYWHDCRRLEHPEGRATFLSEAAALIARATGEE